MRFVIERKMQVTGVVVTLYRSGTRDTPIGRLKFRAGQLNANEQSWCEYERWYELDQQQKEGKVGVAAGNREDEEEEEGVGQLKVSIYYCRQENLLSPMSFSDASGKFEGEANGHADDVQNLQLNDDEEEEDDDDDGDNGEDKQRRKKRSTTTTKKKKKKKKKHGKSKRQATDTDATIIESIADDETTADGRPLPRNSSSPLFPSCSSKDQRHFTDDDDDNDDDDEEEEDDDEFRRECTQTLVGDAGVRFLCQRNRDAILEGIQATRLRRESERDAKESLYTALEKFYKTRLHMAEERVEEGPDPDEVQHRFVVWAKSQPEKFVLKWLASLLTILLLPGLRTSSIWALCRATSAWLLLSSLLGQHAWKVSSTIGRLGGSLTLLPLLAHLSMQALILMLSASLVNGFVISSAVFAMLSYAVMSGVYSILFIFWTRIRGGRLFSSFSSVSASSSSSSSSLSSSLSSSSLSSSA